ncbi:MAG TPA: hypothetical protein VFY29_19745 [Terriglobia bacterium]|nr:hypothetical protein [Terriglobia bacterium]
MKIPSLSALFLIGVLAAGSTALGYYYYYVYDPPLQAAEQFMRAMETRDAESLKQIVLVSDTVESEKLREPEDSEIQALLEDPFVRGRILDQRRREGGSRNYDYLVYRERGGQVYALLLTTVLGRYRVVIPETPSVSHSRFLWEYAWTN